MNIFFIAKRVEDIMEHATVMIRDLSDSHQNHGALKYLPLPPLPLAFFTADSFSRGKQESFYWNDVLRQCFTFTVKSCDHPQPAR